MYALRGQVIQLENIGSLAGVTIEAKAIVRSRGGSTQSLTIEAFTAQSDRTLSDPVPSDERTRSEGEVVAASVRLVSGAPVRGQLFVILSVRGGQELCRGYLTSLSGVNLGEFEDSLSGEGFMRTIELGDPDANTDYTTQTIPTNVAWKLRGFFGQLVQGATQQPKPGFLITDGTFTVAGGTSRYLQPSSTTALYFGITHASELVDANSAQTRPIAYVQLPFGRFSGGYEVRFPTHGKGANTNWGAGLLLVEEWLAA